MDNFLHVAKLIAAAIGSFVGVFLGDITGPMMALLFFIVIDYVTGVFVAYKNKTLSSKVGAVGIAKKICLLLIIGVGNIIDVYILGNGAAIRTAVIFFYLANEGISLIENCAALGVPVPEKVKDVLAQLTDKE
jgi:toxin secretion/phage lysis holin